MLEFSLCFLGFFVIWEGLLLVFICLFFVVGFLFPLAALACPVNTSVLHSPETQVFQRLEIFAALPLMISHKIKVCNKQTLEI